MMLCDIVIDIVIDIVMYDRYCDTHGVATVSRID